MATRYFNTALEEQVYIEQYNSLKADLEKVIKDGILSPVRRVSIPPRESCNLVAVLTAPNRVTEQDSRQVGKIRRMDKAIKIKLIEYDQDLLDRAMYHRGRLVTYTPDVSHEIPERILPITAKVWRRRRRRRRRTTTTRRRTRTRRRRTRTSTSTRTRTRTRTGRRTRTRTRKRGRAGLTPAGQVCRSIMEVAQRHINFGT
eukprot:755283-Hanusia_phi.AAC.1